MFAKGGQALATHVITHNSDQAARWAERFADHLKQGDCLLLSGPVGAGKTHFARSVIQSLLVDFEDVPSPTFTLVQTYPTRIGEIWHADLYRLGHVDELTELGLEDAFDTAVTLIEWPDRLGGLHPTRYLDMVFGFVDDTDTRILKINPVGSGWDWLEDLRDV